MSSDQISTTYIVQATPEKSTYDLSNVFVQWDMAVVPNALRFTIGSKLEHNDYTGYELQPNARMVWTPHDRHTVWSAVARAVRTPGRGEREATILVATVPPLSLSNPAPLPMKIVMEGSNQNQSESMIAYEAGYRLQVASNLVFDLAAYYNVYQDLMNGVVGAPTPNAPVPEYILVPISIVNDRDTKYYGSELVVDWQVGHDSKLRGTYSYIHSDVGNPSLSLTPTQERAGPKHQFSLALFTSPLPWLDWSTRVRHVDEVASANIDAYTTADVRIAIKPHTGVEFAIVGQDLADAQHPEYVSEMLRQNSQVQRRVYATLKLSF